MEWKFSFTGIRLQIDLILEETWIHCDKRPNYQTHVHVIRKLHMQTHSAPVQLPKHHCALRTDAWNAEEMHASMCGRNSVRCKQLLMRYMHGKHVPTVETARTLRISNAHAARNIQRKKTSELINEQIVGSWLSCAATNWYTACTFPFCVCLYMSYDYKHFPLLMHDCEGIHELRIAT